jgi:hypothetical protein
MHLGAEMNLIQKIPLLSLVLIFIISTISCTPTESVIQTAIAQTLVANPTSTSIPTSTNTSKPTSTDTPEATSTPNPTSTPEATNTPVATNTPKPTNTPNPTSTPDTRSNFEKCEQSGFGVRYVISGTGVDGVSLTWQNDSNGTNQGDYKVPACVTYKNFNSSDFVYISAQIILPTYGAGSITCKIYQGTSIIASASASGFAAIASCSGSLK